MRAGSGDRSPEPASCPRIQTSVEGSTGFRRRKSGGGIGLLQKLLGCSHDVAPERSGPEIVGGDQLDEPDFTEARCILAPFGNELRSDGKDVQVSFHGATNVIIQ